jgi:hypothetical protein
MQTQDDILLALQKTGSHVQPDLALLSGIYQRHVQKLRKFGSLWFRELLHKPMNELSLSACTLLLGNEIWNFVSMRIAMSASAAESKHGVIAGRMQENAKVYSAVWLPLLVCAEMEDRILTQYMTRKATNEVFKTVYFPNLALGIGSVPRYAFCTKTLHDWVFVKDFHLLLWSCLCVAVDIHGSKMERIFLKKTSIVFEVAALRGCVSPILERELRESKRMVQFFTGICTKHDPFLFCQQEQDQIVALHKAEMRHDFGYMRSLTHLLGMCISRVFQDFAEHDEDFHIPPAATDLLDSTPPQLKELICAVNYVYDSFAKVQSCDVFMQCESKFKKRMMSLGVECSLWMTWHTLDGLNLNQVLESLTSRVQQHTRHVQLMTECIDQAFQLCDDKSCMLSGVWPAMPAVAHLVQRLMSVIQQVCTMFASVDSVAVFVHLMPKFKTRLTSLGVEYALCMTCEVTSGVQVEKVLEYLVMRLTQHQNLYHGLYPVVLEYDVGTALMHAIDFLRSL